jgi:tetratricopeptide (TPR) repeat protein
LHLEPAPVEGLLAASAGGVAVVAMVAAVLWWRLRWRREASLVLGCLVTLLPVAQLKPLETALSERFLYLPSVPIALLAAALVSRAIGRSRPAGVVAALALGGLALAHLMILESRVATWRDEVALWSSKESEQTGSLKARLNLAHAFARRGERAEALRWYSLAKEVAPDLAAGLDAEIGSLLGDLGSDETEAALLKALEKMPRDGAIWNNLGFHLHRKGDAEGAARAFRRSVELTPNGASAWLGLALARLTVRDIAESENAAARAIAIDPELGLARAVLAECALRTGRPCDALRVAEGVVLTEPAEQATLERVRSLAREACAGGTSARPETP